MLIRSQSKKGIVNLDNMSYIYVAEVRHSQSDRITYWIDTEKGNLGEYSTEEKAIKVLDWIEEEYLYCERCKARGEEAGTIPSYVFQMPQDSEVQP